jgi:hypothetical protein
MDGNDPRDVPADGGLTEDELDEALRAGEDGLLAWIGDSFDCQAGLADVYRRARRAGQVWPRHEAWGVMFSRELVPMPPN